MAVRRRQGERLEIASGKERRTETGGLSGAGPAPAGQTDGTPPVIGEYLIRRLQDYGIRDVFGIPGDFVLQFYGMLQESPIRVIGTRREDCAGYAADGYARVNGMGAVCVTYCVGGLSVTNSIAGAYAEKSPVIVISGAPGMDERRCRSALAPPRARFQYAAGGLREDHGRLRPAGRSVDGLSRDRPLPRGGRPLQAARLPGASPRPRPQPGPVSASGTSRKAGSATKRRSRRPSKTPSA